MRDDGLALPQADGDGGRPLSRYDVVAFGNRWQLVLVEAGHLTPLFPAYESREAAEAERAARVRRDATIRGAIR